MKIMNSNNSSPFLIKKRNRFKDFINSYKHKFNDQYFDNQYTKKSRKYVLKITHYYLLRIELHK